MSDHDVDESGTNRAWLSVALVVVAIGIAAAATKAAPQRANSTTLSRTGVLIKKDGTVHDGTLLVRGGTITVVHKRGEEIFPRADVMLFEEDFDRVTRPMGVLVLRDGRVLRGHLLERDGGLWMLQGKRATAYAASDSRYADANSSQLGKSYYKKFPRKTFATHDEFAPKPLDPKPTPRLGCVILSSGDVHVGSVLEKDGSVTISQPSGAVTVVPKTALRWIGMGDTGPTPAYWKLHGDKPIKGFTRETIKTPTPPSDTSDDQDVWVKASSNPKVAKAILANSQGRWGEASEAWLELYTEHRRRPFLQNYTNCSTKWIEESVKFFQREEVLERVNQIIKTARASKMLDNEEVRAALGETLKLAIRVSNRKGHPKTAHELVGIMGSLGDDFKAEADALWKSLAPPKMNFEGGRDGR